MRWVGGAVAVLTAGLLLECTARVSLFGAAGLDPVLVESVRPMFQADLLEPSGLPGVGYRLRPNLDTWFKMVPLRTNSQGLRYREIPVARPPGTRRVAVLGSSFTLPAGVALEDAYHARLERRFDPDGRDRVEFVNFAVGTFHPAQSLAVLESLALAYDPELVLFGLTRMGAGVALRKTPPHIIRPSPRSHPFFQSFLWKLLLVRNGRRPPLPEVEYDEPEPGDHEPEIDRVVPNTIERLGRFARRTGIPVVVVRLEFEAPKPTHVDRRAREAARREGLYWVDTRAPFAGLDARSYWVQPLDPHPNAAAHAMFAEVVGDFLVESGLLDEPSDP